MKHIEIDRHFVTEKLDSGLICLIHVKSSDQLANILTKDLVVKYFISLFSSRHRNLFSPS